MPFSILEALLSVHRCSSESSTSLGPGKVDRSWKPRFLFGVGGSGRRPSRIRRPRRGVWGRGEKGGRTSRRSSRGVGGKGGWGASRTPENPPIPSSVWGRGEKRGRASRRSVKRGFLEEKGGRWAGEQMRELGHRGVRRGMCNPLQPARSLVVPEGLGGPGLDQGAPQGG